MLFDTTFVRLAALSTGSLGRASETSHNSAASCPAIRADSLTNASFTVRPALGSIRNKSWAAPCIDFVHSAQPRHSPFFSNIVLPCALQRCFRRQLVCSLSSIDKSPSPHPSLTGAELMTPLPKNSLTVPKRFALRPNAALNNSCCSVLSTCCRRIALIVSLPGLQRGHSALSSSSMPTPLLFRHS